MITQIFCSSMSCGWGWWEEVGVDVAAGDRMCLGNSIAEGVLERRRCRKQGDSSPTNSAETGNRQLSHRTCFNVAS